MEVKTMQRKEISFIIDSEGNIASTIKGIKGASCAGVADEIKSLGKVMQEKRTEEYFVKEKTCRVVITK
jgi:hypothetical protein